MNRWFWALVGFSVLVLALWIVVELDAGGVRPAAPLRRAGVGVADEPDVFVRDVPVARPAMVDATEAVGAATEYPRGAVGESGDAARDAAFEAEGFDEFVLEELPEVGTEVPSDGAEADAILEPGMADVEQRAVTPRKHDGDLSRAALKSAHLRDRTRKTLGGVPLRDLSTTAEPGRRLGELPLGPHLRDRTREGLGGGDLRDLASPEPGKLGARSLKSEDLGSLSRRDDESGDLADRSGP